MVIGERQRERVPIATFLVKRPKSAWQNAMIEINDENYTIVRKPDTLASLTSLFSSHRRPDKSGKIISNETWFKINCGKLKIQIRSLIEFFVPAKTCR